MKSLLLNLYKTHNIKEKVYENWIMKDSLVVLANKDGSIKTIFNVTKDDKENLFYDKIKQLDLISLVADNNKSIIKSADSNNKYSFMFKKEKLNDKLLDTYAGALSKKLDVDIHGSMKKAIENLKKEKYI